MTTSGCLEYTDVRSASNDDAAVGGDDRVEPRRRSVDDLQPQQHDSALQATSSSSPDQCQHSDLVNDVFVAGDDRIVTRL